MRLRFLPWVWGRLEVWGGLETSPWLLQTMRKFNPIVLKAFRTDAVLSTSVKCACTILCLLNGANYYPLMKVHDRAHPRAAAWVHLPFIRQMLGVPPKSTHAGGWKVGRRHNDDPTQEGAPGRQTSAD